MLCVAFGLATLTIPAMAGSPDSAARIGELKQLTIDELMDIEVTSVARRPERRFDAAAAIHVVDQQDIHRSGATRLPEALRLAPNLHVAQIDAGQWAISARGFNNGLANKMLVLIDGRTVYSPLFAGVFWDTQDVFMPDIEQIEVISGPGGAIWGANAVNGVINVTSKRAMDTQGLLVQAGAGTELNTFAGLRYGDRVGSDFHYRASAQYSERDDSRLLNGTQWTDGARAGRGSARADWQASDVSLLTLQADAYDIESGDTITRNHIESDGGSLLGRWQMLGTDSELQLQLYYDLSRRRAELQFDDELQTYDVDFQHRFSLGESHDVIWGLGYRQIEDRFVSTAGQAFLPPRLSHQLFSTFIQDEIALRSDNVHLTVGSKLEHNDYTGFELQPSVRLSVKPNELQTAWAAVSRAVRAPSRFDRDLHIPNRPPFAVVGGPQFVSETLLAYETGYRVQPHPRASFDVAVFYNDYDDIRSVERVNPGAALPLEIRNNLAARSYGLELSTEYRPTRDWRLIAGYRYLDVQLHAQQGSTDVTSVNAEAHDPDHMLILRSVLDLPGNLQLDTTFRYADRIPTHRVGAYEELDARLAWHPLPSLELSVVGRNLLRDHHAEFRPVATRRLIERSVFAAATWRL